MNSLKEQSQGWDKIYEEPEGYKYYDLYKPHQDMDNVANFFNERGVVKVLDIGCGLGRNLRFLQTKGFGVVGIDSSPTAIQKLSSQLDKERSRTELVVGSFCNLPFENGSFHAVVSVQTLNHGTQEEVESGVSEVERVLAPGGAIFITVPGRIASGKVRYSLVKTATQISERIFVPTVGEEVGVPHFIFNRRIINKMFSNFGILRIWKDERDYYCFKGIKK
jgi:SAM-dependent methyltransferase